MTDPGSRSKKRSYERQATHEPGVKRPRYEGQQSVLDVKNGMKQVRTDNRGPPSKVRNILSSASCQSSSVSAPSVVFSKSPLTQSRLALSTEPSNALQRIEDANFRQKYDVKVKQSVLASEDNLHYSGESLKLSSAGKLPAVGASNSWQHASFSYPACQSANQIQKTSISRMNDWPKTDDSPPNVLTKSQWSDLSALHRARFHEFDHPPGYSSTMHLFETQQDIVLRNQSSAELWRNGIRNSIMSLLRLSRHSFEYICAFIHLAEDLVKTLSLNFPKAPEWLACQHEVSKFRLTVKEVDSEEHERWCTAVATCDGELLSNEPDTERIESYIHILLCHHDAVERIMNLVSSSDTSFAFSGLGIQTKGAMDMSGTEQSSSRKDAQTSLLLDRLTQIWESKNGNIDNEHAQMKLSCCTSTEESAARFPSAYTNKAEQNSNNMNLFTTLDYHQSYLLLANATHHPLAPVALRKLARKYQMPKDVWHAGLSRLMQQITNDGVAQDILYWIRYGHNYIQGLREAAPDLEPDWIRCQKSLDAFRCELEKCLPLTRYDNDHIDPLVKSNSFDFPNQSGPTEQFWNCMLNTRQDILSSMDYVDIGIPQQSQPPDNELGCFFQSATSDIPGVDFLDSTSSTGNPANSVSKLISDPEYSIDHLSYSAPYTQASERQQYFIPDLSQTIDHSNLFYTDELVQNMRLATIDPNHYHRDPLDEATKRLRHLKLEELSKLRSLVLKCWGFIGQIFDFEVFTKVHGILARCGLKLEGQAAMRETFIL